MPPAACCLPYPPVQILDGSCPAGKSKAAWGLCLVLVTDKPDTPALFKSLSVQHSGNIAFGEAKLHSEAAQALGAQKAPSLYAICNGDLESKLLYSGDLKSEPLQRYLRDFTGGKKCSSMVRIDPSTDFSKFSASALKQIVRDRSIDCRGCFEKADFIRRIKETLAVGHGSSGESAKTEL